jgi:hypothetical protein
MSIASGCDSRHVGAEVTPRRRSHPVEGGSANDYDYANGDPINNYDLDGNFSCSVSRGITSHPARGNKSTVKQRRCALGGSIPMARIDVHFTLYYNGVRIGSRGTHLWDQLGAWDISRQKSVSANRFDNAGVYTIEWSADITPPPGLKIAPRDENCVSAGRGLHCYGLVTVRVFADGSWYDPWTGKGN